MKRKNVISKSKGEKLFCWGSSLLIFYKIYHFLYVFFLQNDQTLKFNHSFESGAILYNFMLFAGLITLFIKKPTLKWYIGAAYISYFFGMELFVEHHFYDFLIENNIVSRSVNPQTPRLLLYLFFVLVCVIKIFSEKKKRLNSFFALIALLVPILTTSLYHHLIIVTSTNDIQNIFFDKMERIIEEKDKKAFIESCRRNDFSCHILDNSDYRSLKDDKLNDSLSKRYQGFNKRTIKEVNFISHNNTMLNYLLISRPKGDEHRVVYSAEKFNYFKRNQIIIFYILSFSALLVWSFIIVFVSIKHQHIIISKGRAHA